jgi:hypothetical protein
MKSSFEDHMRIVEGSTKTASASKVTPSLLDKLAAEMAVEAPAKAAIPAATTVIEAAPAVVAASAAIEVPQTTIVGGDEAEKAKGEQAAPTKPSVLAISAGDGKPVPIATFSKDPAAVAEAAEPTSKTASLKEAEEIGKVMAHSYIAEMRKIAVDQQYSEAVEILKEAGLLEGYNFEKEVEKTAEAKESSLEKIANHQPLTKDDIVSAAIEYSGLEKQAADAEEYGREQARKYFADLVKKAENEVEEEASEEDKKEDEAEAKKKETEKKSSDAAFEKAVNVLVKAGIVKV